MRRYNYLSKDSIHAAFAKLASAFLIAKTETEIKQILFSLFTSDERTKLGRRIQVAQMIKDNVPYRDITQELQVGKQTIMMVVRRMDSNPEGFQLILSQEGKQGKNKRKYYIVGGSKMIYKRKVYINEDGHK